MSRRNPSAKWVLPEVVEPPDVLCVTIRVPNERFYKAAFWGAMLDLASAYKWADDPAHTAKDVATVWRDIIDNLKFDTCPIEPAVLHGMEVNFDVGIRIDCDCNVWVTCCDGTEKQLLTANQVKDLISQPAGGSPQPAPGGGCQQYHANMPANSIWLLPTEVSTGDTIEVSPSGATNDPDQNLLWYCPNGDQFFAGACVGYPVVVGGSDPLPSIAHMRLIARIGTTYYDVLGSTFTVPSGHASDTVTFQVNDDNLSNDNGSLSFDVTVCNNATPGWTHTSDFKLSPDGWHVNNLANDGGTWVPGVGWETSTAPINGCQGCTLQIQWSSNFNVKTATIYYYRDSNAGSGGSYFSTASVAYPLETAPGEYVTSFVLSPTMTNFAFIDLSYAPTPGSEIGIIRKIVLAGDGPNPWG